MTGRVVGEVLGKCAGLGDLNGPLWKFINRENADNGSSLIIGQSHQETIPSRDGGRAKEGSE